MGNGNSAFVCAEQTNLPDCLLSSGTANNQIVFSSSELACAWVFSEPGVGPGSCISVAVGNLTCPNDIDTYNELQQTAPPGFSAPRPWLLNTLSPCLNLGPARQHILVGQQAVIIAVFAILLVIQLFGIFARPALVRWSVHAIYVVYVAGVLMLVGMAVAMSWTETNNIALLPMFALYALGAESLHFLPVDPAKSATTAAIAVFERCGAVAEALPRLRSLLLVVGCLLGLTVVLVLALATAFGVAAPFMGFRYQLSSSSELEAVMLIALLDVMATFGQGLLLCFGLAGHRHSHAFADRPWVLGGITLAFGVALSVILSKIRGACDADDVLSYHGFEHCEAIVGGRAYALAFVSMTRQVTLAFLDALCEPCCQSRRNGRGQGHGHGDRHDIDGLDATAATAAGLDLASARLGLLAAPPMGAGAAAINASGYEMLPPTPTPRDGSRAASRSLLGIAAAAAVEATPRDTTTTRPSNNGAAALPAPPSSNVVVSVVAAVAVAAPSHP